MDTEVRHHFDEISADYYEIVGSTPFLYGYYHAKEVEFVRKMLNLHLVDVPVHSGKRPCILDIGCASGRVIRALREVVPEALFVGLDLSPRMIRSANSRKSSDVDLIVGDIRHLPFRGDSFDFAYSLEVIEHLDSKAIAVPKAVQEMARVTRPRGYAAVESTSTNHFHLQGLLTRVFFGLHTSLFDDKSLMRHLQTYAKAPLPVAGPSSFLSIKGLILQQGGTVKAVSWIRVLPEQAFIILRKDSIRRLMTAVDELLSRIPILQNLGREFIILSQKAE